jgi:zinc protease
MTFRIIITVLLTAFFLPAVSAPSFVTEEWHTENGTHVVFHTAPEVPILDIIMAFTAGSAFDGKQWGLSALTTGLLDQGNAGLDASAVANAFADLGVQYGGVCSQDMMALALRTLVQPETLNRATDLFAQLINHPDFPKDAFLRKKNQQLRSLIQDKESPDTQALQAFYRLLYGTHPYAHPINGTQKTVNALTQADVQSFYRQFIVGRNAILVMVGAIDSKTAHDLAERITHDLPKGEPAKPLPKAHPLTSDISIDIPYPSSQTVVRLGQLGITHLSQDYFPLQVGSYILGGGSLVSRLANELREKRGLTYGVYSQFSPMPGGGPFILSFSTQNKQTLTALDVSRKTLASFIQSGPTEQELIAAKQYLTGSFPMSLASNRSIADMLLKITFYHLPQDFLTQYVAHINAIGVEDIKQAFQRHINLEKLLQVTVGGA